MSLRGLIRFSAAASTLALVQGRVFPPGSVRAWLGSARRGGDFLFLRYALG